MKTNEIVHIIRMFKFLAVVNLVAAIVAILAWGWAGLVSALCLIFGAAPMCLWMAAVIDLLSHIAGAKVHDDAVQSVPVHSTHRSGTPQVEAPEITRDSGDVASMIFIVGIGLVVLIIVCGALAAA